MGLGEAIYLLRSGIYELIVIAAPLLLVGMLVGLIVSIFQATTSIQEQTLTFVPKILAILLVLLLLGPWMLSSLSQFTVHLFQMIPEMGG
ncbi:flagellar biosynthesis protein FliQ [Spirochaeta thermophila]|uniref:Flagellar biosynthetic protein FliQ n=2 Tax=Winmispira thermophila TaxID=154 RepID=G0GCE1_WINT7|nr:flagellar biosynthesis protein FliQ [Spirochaeta thermophila]ADN01874.1 flagellar biosynthesis protein [Spirochaeta thermophila DSM 6192]AEJ61226.1 flagellar biosynthetic protein FliQ [Spirochaeta thermophila DSM 6578]